MKQTIFLQLILRTQVFFSQTEEKKEVEHLQKYLITNADNLIHAANLISERIYSRDMEEFIVFCRS